MSLTKNNELTEAYTGDGKIINSDFLNGLSIKDAKEKIINKIEENKNRYKKNIISAKRLGYI